MKKQVKRQYTKRSAHWTKNGQTPKAPSLATQLRFTVKDVRITQAPNGKITLYLTTS